MRKLRAILHIGTAKTGTTSIQRVLREVREVLPPLGFAYSRAAGKRNHLSLPLYAEGGHRRNGLFRHVARQGKDSAEVTEWFPEELAREIEALPKGVHTMVFSSEQLHSRVDRVSEVERLKALLDRFFSEYMIVVYLRRQDELAVSRYTTVVRTGGTSSAVLPDPSTDSHYYNYKLLLDRWADAFGREAIRPRIFARSELLDGDVVRDFLNTIGMQGLSLPEDPVVRGPSLVPAAQELVRRFNAQRGEGASTRRPAWVPEFLNQRFAGPGAMPSRAEAEAFLATFAASNEAVRADYFPERKSLFSMEFGRYPEVSSRDRLTDGAVLEVALASLRHVMEEVASPGSRAKARKEKMERRKAIAGEAGRDPAARSARKDTRRAAKAGAAA